MYHRMTGLLRTLPVLSARYAPRNSDNRTKSGITNSGQVGRWDVEWLSPSESSTAVLKRDVAIAHMAAIASSMVQEMDALFVYKPRVSRAHHVPLEILPLLQLHQ